MNISLKINMNNTRYNIKRVLLVVIASSAIFTNLKMFAQEYIIPRPLEISFSTEKKYVTFKKSISKIDKTLEEKLGKEGYELNVDRDGNVYIVAATETGIFYAKQTLMQLRKPEEIGQKKYSVPAGLKIIDKPRFEWRAFMLDEARHFFGVEAVKDLLDQMAQLKMNVFHWHLTDDVGWRIEIKKYPKLTSVGSKRADTEAETWDSGKLQGKPHSGFYTQEQIKEIIEYATARHITIVPEIDIPGHSSAACASYPELKLTLKQPKGVPITFGGNNNTALDPSNEKVYEFYNDIFDELIELFPSKIIHIGGDEVRYDKQWKGEKKLQDFMKKNGMKSFTDLQLYFTNRIAKMLEKKGVRVVGWTEVLGTDIHGDGGGTKAAGNVDRSLIVHHWDWQAKTDELVKNAARAGQKIVNAKLQWTYISQKYEKIPFKKTYTFEPIFNGLEAKYHKNIIGLGAQVWTEWIPDVKTLHYMVFPRLISFAEIGWSSREGKKWDDFLGRVKKFHTLRMDYQGISYAKDQVK